MAVQTVQKASSEKAATTATTASPSSTGAAPAVAASVLDALATRFRPGGVFLTLLRADSTVAYHDAAAGTFFTRYVLPMLQYPEPGDNSVREKLATLNANSN